MTPLTRKQREINEREQLILSTAQSMLHQHGYNYLTMDRVAETVEYSKGTIYNHFASKEDLVCSLERPEEAENLTAAEKVAIRYGELMATDHLSIDDALYAELKTYYTQEQIVELGMVAAFFVGFGRLAATYHMVDELPQAFQEAESDLSPWGNEAVVVR